MRSLPVVLLFACSVAATLAQAQGAAQPFPVRPVRIIVPYQPGGITDTLARLVGQKLGTAWDQTVIVENRPGGSANIGSELAVKAAPDGYTLLWGGIANAVAPALYPRLSYDPLRDFAWVTNLTKVPLLIAVHPVLPVRNASDMIKLAKAKPGDLLYASSGIATSGHLAAELFMSMTGAKITHIPYKGSASSLLDVLSGQIPVYFGAIASPLPHVKSGRLRAIAVTTIKRSPAIPDVPSLDEQGLQGFEFATWYGVAAPAGTPKEIIAKTNGEIVRIMKLPEIRERLAAEGSDVVGDTPEEITAFVRAEVAKWGRIVKQANIKPE